MKKTEFQKYKSIFDKLKHKQSKETEKEKTKSKGTN